MPCRQDSSGDDKAAINVISMARTASRNDQSGCGKIFNRRANGFEQGDLIWGRAPDNSPSYQVCQLALDSVSIDETAFQRLHKVSSFGECALECVDKKLRAMHNLVVRILLCRVE